MPNETKKPRRARTNYERLVKDTAADIQAIPLRLIL